MLRKDFLQITQLNRVKQSYLYEIVIIFTLIFTMMGFYIFYHKNFL